MRGLPLTLVLLACTGCGYHTAGSATHLPAAIRTVAVPAFATRSQAVHTEFTYTQAMVRELNTRTRLRVVNTSPGESLDAADATLEGTILSQTSSPLTYDSSSGQTSSYLITVVAQVVLTARDGHVLYRNDAVTLREQFQSTQDLSGFIQEDSPAVQRLARDFAHTVVSNLMEAF